MGQELLLFQAVHGKSSQQPWNLVQVPWCETTSDGEVAIVSVDFLYKVGQEPAYLLKQSFAASLEARDLPKHSEPEELTGVQHRLGLGQLVDAELLAAVRLVGAAASMPAFAFAFHDFCE